MKTEKVIKPGIACRTKNEIEYKAFEAACVAAGYKADVDQYDGSSYEYSYLSEFGVTQTDKEERFKDVSLEDVLFCPSIVPEWAVDVRTSGSQFFWTNNRGRFREIFAGDHEGNFTDRAWHSVEMEIIATRPQAKPEKWMPEVGEFVDAPKKISSESGVVEWFGYGRYEVCAYHHDTSVVFVRVISPDGEKMGYMHLLTKDLNVRPIKTDREKFIEQAGAVFGTACDIGALYDAGCRFVEGEQ